MQSFLGFTFQFFACTALGAYEFNNLLIRSWLGESLYGAFLPAKIHPFFSVASSNHEKELPKQRIFAFREFRRENRIFALARVAHRAPLARAVALSSERGVGIIFLLSISFTSMRTFSR